VVYAPATFIIKGIMALITYFCFQGMHNKLGNTFSRIIGGTLAEIEMILGYFVFEGFMYGFAPSVVNIPANAVQGVAGLIIGIVLVKIFEKTKMF
ncbi:MAG: ECF transporter S component, partial [Clostridia bacterium]|nr:ECF transporter S component [Clostridia bacterium]